MDAGISWPETHNMGISKWDTIVEKAESVLCNQFYNGRNLRYPLPKHINSHHDSQGDLTRAADHIPYGVPYYHVRVNQLPKSIQMGYQSVIADKTHILGNVQLREDFELAADFLNLAAPLKCPDSNTRSISSICGSE